jgi:hypothetical protein
MKSLRRLVRYGLVLRPCLTAARRPRPQGSAARHPGRAACHRGETLKASGNGAMTVDVPGATVVAKGTLGTDPVLLVRSPG